MNVVLADDSEMVRRRLAGLLGAIPNVRIVAEAESVSQAIDAIDVLEPDLLIVDLHMPGNGLRLVKQVGRRVNSPTIIVLTNYAYDQYRNLCLKSGAEFFFDKVTEFESVVRVVTDLSLRRADRRPLDNLL